MERLWSSLLPTAPDLIWVAPTLLRGSLSAAYDVPPSATKRAIVATTLAYDRRSITRCSIGASLRLLLHPGHLNTHDARSARSKRISRLGRHLRTEAVGLTTSRSIEDVRIAPRTPATGARRGECPPPPSYEDLKLDELALLGDAPGADHALEANGRTVRHMAAARADRGTRAHVQHDRLGDATNLR